jgi:nanoRNase/pAp phosphatase (c-di-AMP/oligoRNAs hydrolase)
VILFKKSVQLGITLGGGGHNLAAGVSLKKNKLNTFKNFINKNYKIIIHNLKIYIRQNYLLML